MIDQIKLLTQALEEKYKAQSIINRIESSLKDQIKTIAFDKYKDTIIEEDGYLYDLKRLIISIYTPSQKPVAIRAFFYAIPDKCTMNSSKRKALMKMRENPKGWPDEHRNFDPPLCTSFEWEISIKTALEGSFIIRENDWIRIIQN